MRFLAFVVALFALSACFLKQQPPANMVQTSTDHVDGVIRLEEIRGEASAATIEARFTRGKKARTNGVATRYLDEGDSWLSFTDRNRASECGAYKISKSWEERASNTITMGKFWLALPLQTNPTEIPEDAEHRYSKKLDPGLVATSYPFQVDGTKDIAGFKAAVWLPEALQEVTVAASLLEDGVSIKKGGPLKLEWNAPQISRADHVMLLEIYDEQSDGIYLVRCLVTESELGKSGRLAWLIDPKYIAVMPPTQKGELFLSRVIPRAAQSASLKIESQGFQTHFAQVVLE